MTETQRQALSSELEQRAREEGFEGFGIAEAKRLDRDAEALEAWLRRERHAAMAWMARDPDKRSDPRRLLPGCRSLVVLAMNYYPGAEAAYTPPGRARVALYARGRDYHKIVGGKVKRLAAWLAEATSMPARGFVDTGPVLERAWAERAGVGWIGKNSCLITRDMGSWLLLGEILSVAPLRPSAGPHEEFCGTCSACIDACPTQAIVSPGSVDSRRCISYWTIEHRGSVPEGHRLGNADWIFGCDVCQEVCPWNHKSAAVIPSERFERRDDMQGLDPEEILLMDETRFRERFAGTSLMRAKWEGMRRNACIVLGNRGDPRSLPLLAGMLNDPDVVIREHAAWAMRRIGGAPAAPRPRIE